MTKLHRFFRVKSLVGAAAFVFACSTSSAAFYPVDLSGGTEYAGWSDLNAANFPTYPTGGPTAANNPWPAPIVANEAGSSDSATFDKVSGGGYFASTSIYSFMTPGTFTVADSSPMADLETVVLQIEQVGGFTSGPSLSYNGGSQALAADIDFSINGGTATGFGDSEILVYQWDLSEIGSVTDFAITYTGAEHLSQLALQMNSGDTFTAVPEPSTYAAFAGLAVLALGFICRRNRR